MKNNPCANGCPAVEFLMKKLQKEVEYWEKEADFWKGRTEYWRSQWSGGQPPIPDKAFRKKKPRRKNPGHLKLASK